MYSPEVERDNFNLNGLEKLGVNYMYTTTQLYLLVGPRKAVKHLNATDGLQVEFLDPRENIGIVY